MDYRIIVGVCEEFEITIEQLTSKVGTRHLTNARIACAFLLRSRLNHTHQFIANTLNRDHSTVTYFLQKEQDYRFTKDVLITQIQRIETKLFKQP